MSETSPSGNQEARNKAMIKSLEPAQLAKHNVTLEDRNAAKAGYVWLCCNECGARWSPILLISGRLPRYFWRCPNGCNDNANGK
jgi:hypothetical protein